MNILSKISTAAALLLTTHFASAAQFDITPEDTFSNIAAGNFGVLTYNVHSPSTSTFEGAGIPGNSGALPVGVTQMFGSIGSTQSCGAISITLDSNSCAGQPCDEGDTSGKCFTLSPQRQNCTLYLCVNGTQVNANPNHIAKGGPQVCGYPRPTGSSSCSVPYDFQQINVTGLTSPNATLQFSAATIASFLPSPPNPANTALLQPGSTFTWTLTNTGPAPAQAVRPIFSAAALSNFVPGSLNFSNCFNTPLPSLASCDISVSVKSTATLDTTPDPVLFEGTNTNVLTGNVVFDLVGALSASPVSFHAPGAAGRVPMTLTNHTGIAINIASGGFSFAGINVNTVAPVASPNGGSCGAGPAFTVPANSSCTVILEATADAYVTTGSTGTATIQYTQGSITQSTSTDVAIDNTVLLINNNLEIDIPGTEVTTVEVPLVNVGEFNLHGLNAQLIPGTLANVTLQPLPVACTNPLVPHATTCNATLTVTPTPSGSGALTATGANITATTVNVDVNNNNISMVILPATDQHLQYQGIQVNNNFSVASGQRVYLTDVIINGSGVNPIPAGDLVWCKSTDTSSCDYVSTCIAEAAIAPQDSCILWFKGNDGTQTPFNSSLTGTIQINVAESISPPGELWEETFNVGKIANLYVAGFFDTAGATSANNIAKWNANVTNQWQALDAGLSSVGRDLVIYKGDLYVVGSFANASSVSNTISVASWNGNNWNSVDGGLQLSSNPADVETVLVDNGILYAAGLLDTAGSETGVKNIAQFDGNTWNPLGNVASNGTDAFIKNITAFNNGVYVGGQFNNVTPPSTAAYKVAGWSPLSSASWSVLGAAAPNNGTSTGLGNVFTLLPDSTGNNLYVGGEFSALYDGAGPGAVANTNLIGSYNKGTNQWSPVGVNTFFTGSTVGTLTTFGTSPQLLYAGGVLTNTNQFVAFVDPSNVSNTWQNIGSLNSEVYDLYNHINVNLYAAGVFTTNAATDPLNGVAYLSGSDWHQIDGGLAEGSGNGTGEAVIVASSITITP